MLIRERIRALLEDGPARFVDTRGEAVAPEELRRQYQTLRAWIARQFRPGQRVAIRLPVDYPNLLCIYACMDCGVAYVPLQPEWPDHRVEQIRRLSQFEAVIDEDMLGRMQADADDPPPQEALDPESPLYIIFTSGSTGEPKGVVIPRRAFEQYVRWLEGAFASVTPDDRMLTVTKFTFDLVMQDVGLLLARRPSVYFSAFNGNVFRMAMEIERHRITILDTVPNNAMLLMEEAVFSRANLSSLRHLMLGGARFPYALLSRLREKLTPDVCIYNFYGPTETTIYTHVERLQGDPELHHRNGNVSVGRPMPGVSSLIVGPDGQLIHEPWKEGELLLGGVQVMLEYCSNPEKTGQALETRDGVRYYHTGDVSFVDEVGRYYITGRMDETIKRRGYRVNLLDIDAYIMQLPYVHNCMTLAFSSVEAENVLLSVIVTSRPITPDDVRRDLRSLLADYQIPDHIEFVSTLPLNNSGKVSRKELTRVFQSRFQASPEA